MKKQATKKVARKLNKTQKVTVDKIAPEEVLEKKIGVQGETEGGPEIEIQKDREVTSSEERAKPPVEEPPLEEAPVEEAPVEEAPDSIKEVFEKFLNTYAPPILSKENVHLEKRKGWKIIVNCPSVVGAVPASLDNIEIVIE